MEINLNNFITDQSLKLSGGREQNLVPPELIEKNALEIGDSVSISSDKKTKGLKKSISSKESKEEKKEIQPDIKEEKNVEIEKATTTKAKSNVPTSIYQEDETIAVPESPIEIRSQDEPGFSAPELKEKQALRKQVFNVIKNLKDGKYKDKEFSDVALKLAECAHYDPDPFVGKMAKYAVTKLVQFGSPATEWAMKIGPIDGPVQYFERLTRTIEDTFDKKYITDKNEIPDFLGMFAHCTNGYLIPEKALKSVAHFANSLFGRSKAKLDDELRAKEPSEKDLEWSGQCASLVEKWWKSGQIEVLKDEKPIPFGSFDLKKEIMENRAYIQGSSIDLKPRGKTVKIADKTKEILKKIDLFDKEKTDNVDAFEKLIQGDPAEGQRALDSIIYGVEGSHYRSYGDFNQLAYLLKNRENRPGLAGILDARKDKMATLISDENAKGFLVDNNLDGCYKVDFLENFSNAYPDLMNKELFNKEVAPILTCDEINTEMHASEFMERLWEKRPDMVSPALDAILSNPKRFTLDERHWRIMEKAIENYGWKPDGYQLEQIVSRAYQPLIGNEDFSVFSGYNTSNEYMASVRVMTRLRGKYPDILKKMSIPDKDGQPLSPEKAVLSQVLNDPSTDTIGKIFDDSFRVMKTIKDFCLGDKETVEDLLKTVHDGLRKAGNIDGMKKEERAAIAVLGSADLDENQLASFKEALSPALRQKQGYYVYIKILDKFRLQYIDAGNKTLAEGKLSPGEHIRKTIELFDLDSCMGFDRSERIGQSIYEATSKGFPQIMKEPKNVFSAFKTIAKECKSDEEIAGGWELYKEIFPMVGGEPKIDNANESFVFVNEQIKKGIDKKTAILHAVRCCVLDMHPGDTPIEQDLAKPDAGAIKQGDDCVIIGGIKLDKNI